ICLFAFAIQMPKFTDIYTLFFYKTATTYITFVYLFTAFFPIFLRDFTATEKVNFLLISFFANKFMKFN
ncbi:MAG: hypothetical protein LBT56_00410, partial [Prevotellaceae bacterium]|nr:hypothetical protein [Prevotellaceae bacterium]